MYTSEVIQVQELYYSQKKKERKEKKKKVDACSDLVCRLPQHQIKNKTTADVGCLFLLTVGDDSLLFLLL